MNKLTILAYCMAMLSFLGCKDLEITPENNKEAPIALEVKETSNGLEISWQEAKLSAFQNYKLTRTIDSLPVFGNFNDTTWVIDDFKKNKIIDKNLPFTGKFYYQLIIESRGRIIKSNKISYQRKDILSFDNLFYNGYAINAPKKIVYLIGNDNFGAFNEITVLNLETGKKGNTLKISNGLNFTFNSFQEDPDNLYIIGANEITVFNSTDLSLKVVLKNINPAIDQFNSVTYYNGKYYVSLYTYPSIIRVFDEKGEEVETYKTNQSLDYNTTIRNIPSQNKLVLLRYNSGYSDASIIDLKSDGTILSGQKVQNITSVFSGYYFSPSPDGNKIISNNRYVLDKSLKLIKTLSVLNTNSQEASFSPDSKHFNIKTNSGFSIYDSNTFIEKKFIPFMKGFSTISQRMLLNNSEAFLISEVSTFGTGAKSLNIIKSKY